MKETVKLQHKSLKIEGQSLSHHLILIGVNSMKKIGFK